MTKRTFEPELDGFPVAVLRVDARLRPVDANHAWLAMTNRPLDREGTDWLAVFEANERRRVRTLIRHVQKSSAVKTAELRAALPDGWLEVRIAPVHDGSGTPDVLVVALDISEQKRREAYLNFDVTHDALTGLHNRIALLEHTQLALAKLQRDPSTLALLYVDLDRFKDINDRYGHAVGDEVLVRAARRMRLALRPSDMLARSGGDEFVALCESFQSDQEAKAVAFRLVRSFDEPIRIDQRRVRLSASVGLALARGGSTWNAPSLLARADKAMYRAKGNRYERIVVDAPREPVARVRSVPATGGDGPRRRVLDGLSRLEAELAQAWARSTSDRDTESTTRWRTASHHVAQAIVALEEATPISGEVSSKIDR